MTQFAARKMRLACRTTLLLCMLTRRHVVSLATKASAKPKVAVIGGGIAGLSCAGALQQTGKFEPVVFDTGRLRPGGRCSSRFPGDPPKEGDERQPILSNALFDHAAQIITVSPDDKDFCKQVEQWKEEGIVKQYPPDSICELTNDGSKLSVIPLDTENMYHGVNGMGSIPQAMVKQGQFEVKQDVWVSPSNGVKFLKSKQQWKVKGYDDDTFDYLVIAHNGKCADRLMSKTPAKALHSLLRVNFNPTVPKHGGKRMTLNSIYSLTFCVKAPSVLSQVLPSPFTCGFVDAESSKELRLVSCQSRKYPREDDVEVWTLLSSPKLAKKYKAPQENLSEDLVDDVTDKLLASLQELLDIQQGVRKSVIERRLQLWGAAVPLNVYQGGDGFVYDSKFAVGVCGDWLVEPSIAGAWTSGQRLADYMVRDAPKSVGLPSKGEPAVFRASSSVSKAGIGSLLQNKRQVSRASG